MSEKKRIVLHGYLKDLYPHPIELAGETVAELINGFCKQTKALDPKPGEDRHQIRVQGFETIESLYAPTDVEEIHLVPEFSGGKEGGFFQILLGAALIGAMFIPGVREMTIAGVGVSGLLFSAGASLLLGGLLQLISPAPQLDSQAGEQDPEASKYLGAPKNTVKIGTRIPIIYGRVKHGGHYLSFDVDAKRVSV